MTNNAKAVLKELQLIASHNNGCLPPEKVVEFARDPGTHLHAKFEWQDSQAAHEYRLWQARQIIVRVQDYIKVRDVERKVQIFHSLGPDRKTGSSYRHIVKILSDKDMRKQLLSDALEELERFRTKYAALKELTEVFSAIRKVRKGS